MSHAGVILSSGKGTAEGKYEVLLEVGVRIAEHPENIGKFTFEEMKKFGRV
jgi:succinyl-CoA synthetase alpha subunit